MVTTTLGPSEGGDDVLQGYDAASGGLLHEPVGFGGKEAIGDWMAAGGEGRRKPSVKGALADLHHAVSDTIQSWNPYGPKANGANASGLTPFEEGALNQQLEMRTRVGKCTILLDGDSLRERAIRTHEEHDRLHGYRLHVLRQPLLGEHWSKPAYVLSLLLRELSKPEDERLEWLLWVDADTVILNPRVPIETFLPPPDAEFDDVHLLFSSDETGLNNGVFSVRVNQWAVKFLTATVTLRLYKPDEPLEFRDQSAMNTVIKERAFERNIVQAPQRCFNTYQSEHDQTLAPFQIRRGDLLVHFAGVPNQEERMAYWIERAEKHLDDWELPLKSTAYPEEMKDFWDGVKATRESEREAMAELRLKAARLLSNVGTQLEEYNGRLSDAEKEAINKQRDELDRVLIKEEYTHDNAKISEEIGKLGQTAQPLLHALKESQKAWLNTAHEAIFAGEKELLENKSVNGSSSLEMQTLNTTIQRLKMLITAPQEEWQKATITAATHQLTAAQAKLQAKKAAEAVAAAKKATAQKLGQSEDQQAEEQNGNESAPKDAVVITSVGPATTVLVVQTVAGEVVVATVVGEPVIQVVTQEEMAVTLWTTVEESVPAATAEASSDGATETEDN